MSNIKQKQWHCHECNRNTLHVGTIKTMDMGCGFVAGNLILCLITFGFWIPIFMLILGIGMCANALAPWAVKYHCQVCGGLLGHKTKSRTVPPSLPQPSKREPFANPDVVRGNRFTADGKGRIRALIRVSAYVLLGFVILIAGVGILVRIASSHQFPTSATLSRTSPPNEHRWRSIHLESAGGMKLRDQSCELISVGNDTIQMKINGKQWKFVRGKTYRYPPSGDDFINIILKNTDTEAGTCTIRSSDGDLLTYGLDGQVKIAAEPQ